MPCHVQRVYPRSKCDDSVVRLSVRPSALVCLISDTTAAAVTTIPVLLHHVNDAFHDVTILRHN